MRRWSEAQLGMLVGLVDATLPGEDLSPDEIRSACFDDPEDAVVLADADGQGAVAVAVQRDAEGVVGTVVLIVVAPGAQGSGRGRALVAAAESWAFEDRHADILHVGGTLRFPLWPGLDAHWAQGVSLFESAGYAITGATVAMMLPTDPTPRTGAPVAVRRALDDADAEAAVALAGRACPSIAPEVARGVEQGSCLLAMSTAGEAVGLGCHSLSRRGWLGPVFVVEGARRSGVGRALLQHLVADLRVAGHRVALAAPATPAGFFVRAGGASTSRVYLHLAKERRAATRLR